MSAEQAETDLESERTEPKCPMCGGDGFYRGYGLAGGGMGVYEGCDDCGWFEKTQDAPDE